MYRNTRGRSKTNRGISVIRESNQRIENYDSSPYDYLKDIRFKGYREKLGIQKGIKSPKSYEKVVESEEDEESDYEDEYFGSKNTKYNNYKSPKRPTPHKISTQAIKRIEKKPMIKCPYCKTNISMSKFEKHILTCYEKLKYEKYVNYQKYRREQESYITDKLGKIKVSKEKFGKKFVNFNDTSFNSEDSEEEESEPLSEEDEEASTSNLSGGIPLEVEDGIMKIPDNYKAKNVEVKARYYDPCTNRNNHLMHIQQNTIWLKNIRDTLAHAGYVGEQPKVKPVTKINRTNQKLYVSSSDNDMGEVDSNGYAIPRGDSRKGNRLHKNKSHTTTTIKIPRNRMHPKEVIYSKPTKVIHTLNGRNPSRTEVPPNDIVTSNIRGIVPRNSKGLSGPQEGKRGSQDNLLLDGDEHQARIIRRKCGKCRAKYPSITSKFCAECGQRRE